MWATAAWTWHKFIKLKENTGKICKKQEREKKKYLKQTGIISKQAQAKKIRRIFDAVGTEEGQVKWEWEWEWEWGGAAAELPKSIQAK